MTDLVELANRFVRLSAELEETRAAMKRLLLNGAGDCAIPAGLAEAPRRTKPTPAEVAAAEQALLKAMQAHPGDGTNKLAKLTGSGVSTTDDRLRRLEKRGLIERDASGKRRVVEGNPTSPPQT
jgi:DNA-binding MarR family transcriptional regulator